MKKDDFKEKAYQIVNDLADRIDKLEEKANEIAEDKKNEYREQLDKLKETGQAGVGKSTSDLPKESGA